MVRLTHTKVFNKSGIRDNLVRVQSLLIRDDMYNTQPNILTR